MRYTLIILMAISSILAEDAKPQPMEVQNAMAALEKSVIAARKVYDPVVAKAVNDATMKLNLVKADYMKKGDLEGANLIVEAINKLKSGDVVGEIENNIKNSANIFSANSIVGKWKVSGIGATLVVDNKMKANLSGSLGDVAVNSNGSYTITYDSRWKYADIIWDNKNRNFTGKAISPEGNAVNTITLTKLPDSK